MNAFMRIRTTLAAWSDSSANNNPSLRHIDWTRDMPDLQVKNPQAVSHVVAPGVELTVFDGTRALTIDGTTTFSVALVTSTADRYRFRHTAGASPGFRTDRALNLSGSTYSVTVNANGTAVITRTAGAATFTGVVVGDTVWIPDATEAAGQPFQAANQGFWVVLAVTSTTLTLTRSGDFEAAGESGIVITAAAQLQAFSSAGVQVGDKLRVSAGFVSSTRRTFLIEAVTPAFIEVSSSLAVAGETGVIPGATGMTVYTAGKSVVYVEADQESVIKVNGNTDELNILSPWIAGDPKRAAAYRRDGPTWSLKVLNKSSVALNLLVISAE
jgi:hypothetical protein